MYKNPQMRGMSPRKRYHFISFFFPSFLLFFIKFLFKSKKFIVEWKFKKRIHEDKQGKNRERFIGR